MNISFNCIHEDTPGPKWKALFDRTWPSYKTWFLSEGYLKRKGYLTSMSALQAAMPELIPIYDRLLTLVGGGDLEARFLSLYCPPAYMSGCSQVAWTKDTTALIRNYDYSYKLFEGTMFYTNWLQPVIGVSDCTWGLLDGMNAGGLAASLTFGGRNVSGEGFGIPLIIRYILETSTTVKEGISILKRIPVHMAYNVTLLDREDNFSTVYLSPDRDPIVVPSAIATNHQMQVEWTDYALLTDTIERKKFLEACNADPEETAKSMFDHFLQPPLYSNALEKSFSTLYSIAYRIKEGELEVRWPAKEIVQSFDNFIEQRVLPFAKITGA